MVWGSLAYGSKACGLNWRPGTGLWLEPEVPKALAFCGLEGSLPPHTWSLEHTSDETVGCFCNLGHCCEESRSEQECRYRFDILPSFLSLKIWKKPSRPQERSPALCNTTVDSKTQPE